MKFPNVELLELRYLDMPNVVVIEHLTQVRDSNYAYQLSACENVLEKIDRAVVYGWHVELHYRRVSEGMSLTVLAEESVELHLASKFVS